MADAVVARTLFRALKRVVQDFDRNVALRALLTAVPQRVYHRERRRVIEINSSLLANSVLERVIREVNEGADFYRPAKQLRPSLALETLRRHFREPMLPVRQSDSQSDNELDKVRRAQETMHANPLDAGFEALRWLSSMRASFNELPVGDWRPVRIPAFELAPEQSSMPRIGDVLLTHPKGGAADGGLQAVIGVLRASGHDSSRRGLLSPPANVAPGSDFAVRRGAVRLRWLRRQCSGL